MSKAESIPESNVVRESVVCENRNDPTVELLIPVYKPGEELSRLLVKMLHQTYPLQFIHLLVTAGEEEFSRVREKILPPFCNSGTDDMTETGSLSIAPQLRLTRIAPEDFDHGGTRHVGASQSQADIILCMTQDAVPADDRLVEHLIEALTRDEKIAAVYGRQLPTEDCHIIERYTRQFNYPPQSCTKWAKDLPALGIKTYFCSNVCAAYDRKVYEKLGGFERRTIFNEDMIYAAGLIRSGYGIAYAADARVIHSHNYSGIQQLYRNFDLAVSQAEHPEIFQGVPSEGEGIRMVKSTVAWLCKNGKIYLVPKLVWQSGCKYLGYLLGKRYRKLPRWLVMKLTMNRRYWKE